MFAAFLNRLWITILFVLSPFVIVLMPLTWLIVGRTGFSFWSKLLFSAIEKLP